MLNSPTYPDPWKDARSNPNGASQCDVCTVYILYDLLYYIDLGEVFTTGALEGQPYDSLACGSCYRLLTDV